MTDTLGNKLKHYESLTDYAISPASYWVMRLDGNKFSTFTRKIKAEKPYDVQMSESMRITTEAVMKRFGFVTGYTQSDEITLIPDLIGGDYGNTTELWGLRLQKLTSVIASYASVVFYKEMSRRIEALGLDLIPSFDARIIKLETLDEVAETIRWRQYDCLKNAKMLLAQQHFSHKSLMGVSGNDAITRLLREKGIDFHEMPERYKTGRMFKRIQVLKDAYNPKANEPVEVLRSEIKEFNFLIPLKDPFATAKYVEVGYVPDAR